MELPATRGWEQLSVGTEDGLRTLHCRDGGSAMLHTRVNAMLESLEALHRSCVSGNEPD